MIVLDASVALKWFVAGESQKDEAMAVLDHLQERPAEYLVPELFMNELLAVLCRLPDANVEKVVEALSLIERLGLRRVANGHELLSRATAYAMSWRISGYDAVYVALASLVDGVWLTADGRAATKIQQRQFVRTLGS